MIRFAEVAAKHAAPIVEGRLADAIGMVLEARGCRASLGDLYEIRSSNGTVHAEVVGLRGDRALLMPLGATHGLEAGAPVRRIGRGAHAQVGNALLGRGVAALGPPLDGGPPVAFEEERPLDGGRPRNPLRRRPIDTPFYVGVRAM